MIRETKELFINGQIYTAPVDILEKSDKENIIKMYNMWEELSENLSNYGCRRINFPEISELIFCAIFDCWRTNNTPISDHSSFDCYNPQNHARIQIKAASSKGELTSFGPKSVWDEIYFMDFYNEGNYDGTFKVYLLPNKDIYEYKMNKNETFEDQQKQGRRPRFSLRKLIKALNIKPIGIYNLNEDL